MDRKLAFLGIAVVGLLLASPMAVAQQTQYGSTSGDARFAEDRAKCDAAADGTDTTCVVLYGHLFDLLNKVPINVQRPPDASFDLQQGFTGTPGIEQTGFDFNQLKLESSPGFVEYKDDPNLKPRLHPERGLSTDVELASDVNIFGYWYLSADYDEFSPAGLDDVPPGSRDDPSVGIQPCVTVYMELQTGRFYGDGDTLASGKTTKHIVTAAPLDGTGNPGVPATPCPEQDGEVAIDDVIEFEVDMGTAAGNIPKDRGFIVWVEWWTFDPNGDPRRSEKVYQHQWNLHSGKDYPARVILPVKNPVYIETVRPQFFDGKVYIHGVFNSPWGSYDVDTSTIKAEILDASGSPVSTPNMAEPVLRYSVDHDGHFKPVNATFAWDYQKDNIQPGTYTVRVTAKNWQWSSEVEKTGTIVIAEDISKSKATDSDGNTQEGDPTKIGGAEESPGVSTITLSILGVALLALSRLRRR